MRCNAQLFVFGSASIAGFLVLGGCITGLVFLSIEIAKPYKEVPCSNKHNGLAKVLNVSYEKWREMYAVKADIYELDLRYSLGQRIFSLTSDEMARYNISYYYHAETPVPIYFMCESYHFSGAYYDPGEVKTAWFERYIKQVAKPWYIIALFIMAMIAIVAALCCLAHCLILTFMHTPWPLQKFEEIGESL